MRSRRRSPRLRRGRTVGTLAVGARAVGALAVGALAVGTVAALALPGGVAAAAPVPTSPTPARPSCVVSVGFGPAPTTTCYASLDTALGAAPAAARTGAAAGVVIGIEYFDRNFSGFSWVVRAPRGCADGSTWQLDRLGDYDNQISSFRTFAGCRVQHFDLPGYRGVRTPVQETHRYIGDRLNDRTSAVRWS